MLISISPRDICFIKCSRENQLALAAGGGHRVEQGFAGNHTPTSVTISSHFFSISGLNPVVSSFLMRQ
jgi:hypothetical protein